MRDWENVLTTTTVGGWALRLGLSADRAAQVQAPLQANPVAQVAVLEDKLTVQAHRVADSIQQGRSLGQTQVSRRALWEATRSAMAGAETELLPRRGSMAPWIGEADQKVPPLVQGQAKAFVAQAQQLTAMELTQVAFGLGGESLGQVVGEAVLNGRIRPMALMQLARAVKQQQSRATATTPTAQPSPQFGGSFDLFGATFVIGLTTYIYGKVQKNEAARKLGKTLICIGVIPNLILFGMAIAAFVKVAMNGGAGFF